ncbi:hypothetical protein CDAR_312141 [Caerostris darwini]|uniref:Uncharacterized protein n=1 Tax=Caerostris darwini TaxID=1538125 RepID=A0AAV4S892_9ARAC|nr:hypothetical protein CDAR_312141 [Caerostris darwini]
MLAHRFEQERGKWHRRRGGRGIPAVTPSFPTRSTSHPVLALKKTISGLPTPGVVSDGGQQARQNRRRRKSHSVRPLPLGGGCAEWLSFGPSIETKRSGNVVLIRCSFEDMRWTRVPLPFSNSVPSILGIIWAP